MNLLSEYSKKLTAFKIEAEKIFGYKSIRKFNYKKNFVFEIGIVTSSIDEFESVKCLLDDVIEFDFDYDDPTIYYKGSITSNGKILNVILPLPNSIGLEAAVITTTKLIFNFTPQYVFMVGIAAGNKNISKIGDILIADKALNYNQVVEIEKKGKEPVKKFMHSTDSINKNLKSRLNLFTNSNSIGLIRDQFLNKKTIKTPLKCHIGLMVSGSSLVRSDSKIEEINQSYHGVVGLDMETYGFYFTAFNVLKDKAPYFVSIKSVSDYGDNSNHQLTAEERKNYALYTSSSALISFIKNHIK
ncbi:MAG: hypothetical protein Q8M94_03440 [Ignavibacteria bacterium]|nr:hypothetical protein [Ignavibacteria bacterium]